METTYKHLRVVMTARGGEEEQRTAAEEEDGGLSCMFGVGLWKRTPEAPEGPLAERADTGDKGLPAGHFCMKSAVLQMLVN